MRRSGILFCLIMAVFAVIMLLAKRPLHSEGQNAKPETATERYLILTAGKFKALQQGLDDAANAGFRVISGNAGLKILALEKDPSGKKHEYLVTGSLDSMVKKGKVAGYRVLPFTFAGGDILEIGAVLEKLSLGEAQPEYKVLDTVRTSTLFKEMNQWAEKGFSLVALSAASGNYGLMEKAAGSPASGPADRYVLLATKLTGTMKTELADAVASGHRLAVVAEAGNEMIVALEKRAPGEAAPDYRLITTTFTGKFEAEINAAVGEGYRLLPWGLCAQDRTSMLGNTHEVVAFMEKRPNLLPIQHKILATKRVSTLRKELAEAVAAGWSLSRLFLTFDEQMIMLEKPSP